MGSGGKWTTLGSAWSLFLFEVSWKHLLLIMNFQRLSAVCRAFSSHVWQGILSCEGRCLWGATRLCLPLADVRILSYGVLASLHGVTGPVAVLFLRSSSVSGMLKGLAVCHWDAGKQILSLRRRLLTVLEPVGKQWLADDWLHHLSCLCRAWRGIAGQGQRSLPNPAPGHAWLPNWLSWRLLFIQIRRSCGYADHLRFPSHVHWLNGWLTDLIFELKTQRYSFEMERSCRAHGYPGVIVWKVVSPHICR